MDPALFETILREIREMGTYRVVLSGPGEPSLHPQFDRMLGLMMQLNMEPLVLTNGIGIDVARAKIWATKRAAFRFSIHAGDHETWLRVHPGGTAKQFESLSRIIESLTAAKGPRVSTINVIHKANFRNVCEMIEHARKLGVQEVVFRPVFARDKLAHLVLNLEEEAELHRNLQHCVRLAESYGIRTNLHEYLANNLYVHSGVLRTDHLYREIPCYFGWIHAVFDIDGTMTPCLDSGLVMGRAGKQSIRDMWHSRHYWAFRRNAITMPQHRKLLSGCKCDACCMYKLNVNVYRLLHLKSLNYREP